MQGNNPTGIKTPFQVMISVQKLHRLWRKRSFLMIEDTGFRGNLDTRTVRWNAVLSSWLNHEAEHAGINVSRVLQEALMKVLDVRKAQ